MKLHFRVVWLLEKAFNGKTDKILAQIMQNLVVVMLQFEYLSKVTRTESLCNDGDDPPVSLRKEPFQVFLIYHMNG